MLNFSPIPLYYQVANVLRHRILDGAYHPGERIGTESEMCEQFGVSRITVRQALSDLERDRLVIRRRGSGTFVSQQIPALASMSFAGFLEDLFAQVSLTTSGEVRLEEVPAGEDVARALGLAEGDTVVLIDRVRYLGGNPLAHTASYLPTSVGARVRPEDLQELPLMHILEHRLGIRLEEAVQTIRAVPATAELAERLGVANGSALLQVQRTSIAAGHPVEYVVTHYRADRYQYTVRLGRIQRGER